MNEGSPSGFLSWPWLKCRWRAIQSLLIFDCSLAVTRWGPHCTERGRLHLSHTFPHSSYFTTPFFVPNPTFTSPPELYLVLPLSWLPSPLVPRSHSRRLHNRASPLPIARRSLLDSAPQYTEIAALKSQIHNVKYHPKYRGPRRPQTGWNCCRSSSKLW